MDPIAELEKRIQESKRLLTEQENALAVLKRAFGGGMSISTINTPTTLNSPSAFNFKDLLSDSSNKITLADEVKKVISAFEDNEFTVKHVVLALEKQGYEHNLKNPNARVGQILTGLVDSKVLAKTKEGIGNAPHWYVAKSEMPTVTAAGISN